MEKNKILISVVIPLYNKEKTIVHTLSTVISQTYKLFEVIIVNDGSSDNSVQLINDNFSDSRIRIISQENSGVSVARNKGVEEAKGDWIAFLDADDEWLPDYLSTLMNALIKYPTAEMIGCSSYYKDLRTGQMNCNALIDRYYHQIVRINYFMNPDRMTHVGATIFKKSTFICVGGFKTGIRINEDLLLCGLIAMRGNYVYVGDAFHVYVGGVSGQATSLLQSSDMSNILYVINTLFESNEANKKYNTLVPIYLEYRFLHILLGCLKMNDYEKVNYLLDNISVKQKKYIGYIDWIKNDKMKYISIFFIYLKKLIWRKHGFPRVGENSRYSQIELYKLKQN